MVVYRVNHEIATKALHLKPGISVVGWYAAHPSEDKRTRAKVKKEGADLVVQNPPAHKGRANDHQTLKLVAKLSNRGEQAIGVKVFNDRNEAENRLQWIEDNAKRLKDVVHFPKRRFAYGNALVYHWVAGRRAGEDEKLDALIQLEKAGLYDHPYVKKGHIRINENGPHLLI